MSAALKSYDENLTVGSSLSVVRHRQLETTDNMPAHLRECVHEFGLPIVTVCVKFGITNPSKIRELVKEIWAGARQTLQGGNVRGTLDWLLIQSGSNISAKQLYRLLADNNLVICSVSPTRAMLDASLAEVSGHKFRCTKEEKHRLRLTAALRAALKQSIA